MARLLYNDEWFEEVSSRAHYEAEFEKVLEQEASRLFQSYYFVPFKRAVSSEYDPDTRKPDYALIHKEYRHWWVVEVELAHHSLNGHVLPQVRTLARAQYGIAEVEYLCEQNPVLDKQRFEDMCKGSPPRVLVIADAPVPKWFEALREYRVAIAICQVFRSRMNKYVLRINGEFPEVDDEVLTTCTCEVSFHRFLRIDAPAALELDRQEPVALYHHGEETLWRRTDTADTVFLVAQCDHDLVQGTTYEISRHADGRLIIRKAYKKP